MSNARNQKPSNALLETGEQMELPSPTPLPKLQLVIIYFLQLSEPMTGYVILPIINELVLEFGLTGGDARKVGYYAGAIVSIFYVTETLFVFFWGRLSDRIGRRPVVLTGIFGSGLSMVLFGVSRTFSTLLFSRGLSGAVNGNIGVLKSMIAEMTDESNQARAWSIAPVVFSRSSVAPVIGGVLSHPSRTFPWLFGHWIIWKTYPYLLPCLVASLFPFSAFILAAALLQETLQSQSDSSKQSLHSAAKPSTHTDVAPEASEPSASTPLIKKTAKSSPPTIRSILTPRVKIAILNYGTISLLSMMYSFVQPLFLSTPVGKGGLGLPPTAIGYILGFSGLWNGVFQGLFFPRLHKRLGTKRLFTVSVSSYIPLYAAWPLMVIISARVGSADVTVKSLLLLQQLLYPMGRSGFSCSHIFITSAAPTRNSLGATTGLGQTVASFTRVVGPVLSASLFAVSLQKNLLGGYLVYVILILLVFGALSAATLLPTVMRRASDEPQESDEER